jgi:prevent-host-death family protein
LAKEAKAVSVTQLGDDAAGVVRRVRGTKQPVLVTQRGRTQAVLLSPELYERGERERQILRELVRGEREIATGRGFSLDRLLVDADRVLARARK